MKTTICLITMNIILLNSINVFAAPDAATHTIGRKTINRDFGAAGNVPGPGWAIMKKQPGRPRPTPKKTESSVSKTNPAVHEMHIVHFDFGSSELRPAETKTLYRVLNIKGRGLVESVTGYTCPAGGLIVNERLAKERADTVAKWLNDHGISVQGILARPKCCYVSRTDPAANRRVEIVFPPQHP